MTSLILRIEIGRADIDTPCECSQTRRWSAVGVQTSSAAENCKRAKSDSGAGAKIVHDGPESVFTLARNGRSRCAGIGVHVGPENAWREYFKWAKSLVCRQCHFFTPAVQLITTISGAFGSVKL